MNVRAILILSLLTFFFNIAVGTAVSQEQEEQEERTYVKIQVDGLSCPFCAYGLEKKLKEVEGAKDIYIDVKEGYATLNVLKETQPTHEELEKIVKDAGFTARAIDFSETPFENDGK
jgi:mercuric ion binding protein